MTLSKVVQTIAETLGISYDEAHRLRQEVRRAHGSANAEDVVSWHRGQHAREELHEVARRMGAREHADGRFHAPKRVHPRGRRSSRETL